MFNGQVPALWAAKAYPSLKPLASWVTDFIMRLNALHEWVENGPPDIFWMSGLFFPQAFLTGILQNFARKNKVAIDRVGFQFAVITTPTKGAPEQGCYIRGLFVDGARWDPAAGKLANPLPKELQSVMPLVCIIVSFAMSHNHCRFI